MVDLPVATPVALITPKDTLRCVDVCRQTFRLQQMPSSGSHGKVVWEGVSRCREQDVVRGWLRYRHD
jgi:hypothetical protein